MTERPLIVLVEDEDHLAQGLLFNLSAEGYRTHHEADGVSALNWLLTTVEKPTALLLDVMLPGRDGFSIAAALREAGMFVPIIMLTARGRTEDILEGFAAGADDYVTKPFDLDVLLARLAGVLRRLQWQRPGAFPPDVSAEATLPPEDYILNDLTVSFANLEVQGRGRTQPLTLMEAELLRYLIGRPNKIVSRKEILENVWRVREDTDTRAIDNFIVRLRRCLEPDPVNPVYLLTVRGVGYRFVPPA